MKAQIRLISVWICILFFSSCLNLGGGSRSTRYSGHFQGTGNYACANDNDCDTGYECVFSQNSSNCELKDPGTSPDACSSHTDCMADEFCNLSLSPKDCEQRKSYSTPCVGVHSSYCDKYCESSTTYDDGGVKCGCKPADCTGYYNFCSYTRNRCVRSVQDGGACNSTNLECLPGLSCVGGTCMPDPTPCPNCCTSHAQCPSNNYCDIVTEQCVPGCIITPQNPIVGTCDNAYYCDVGGVCRPKCLSNSDCVTSMEYCNQSEGICHTKLMGGDDCASSCGKAFTIPIPSCGTNHHAVCDNNTSAGWDEVNQTGCDVCKDRCMSGRWYAQNVHTSSDPKYEHIKTPSNIPGNQGNLVNFSITIFRCGCTDSSDCPAGMVCVGSPWERCVEASGSLGQGSSCVIDEQCSSGLVCHSLYGTCLQPTDLGGSCGRNKDCINHRCVQGECCKVPCDNACCKDWEYCSGWQCTYTSY